MKPSDSFLERYNRFERETDALGRVIGVKRLRPSQELKIVGMTADLEGINMQVKDPQGNVHEIPYRTQAMFAASVVEIDGVPITFPRNRAELDAIMDRLDEEGASAVSKALVRLRSGEIEGDEKPEHAAKNSRRTPRSEASSGS